MRWGRCRRFFRRTLDPGAGGRPPCLYGKGNGAQRGKAICPSHKLTQQGLGRGGEHREECGGLEGRGAPRLPVSLSPAHSFQREAGHQTSERKQLVVAQSCLTLRDPMDGRPPGSSVHRILQTRTLEWVAVPFSSIPGPGIEPGSPALPADSFSSKLPGEATSNFR